MRFFQALPLRHKLTLLSLFTSTVALGLTCASFVAGELLTFKKDLLSDVASAAEMIGYNSASALSFNDEHSAEETLDALRAQRGILAACLYDKDGQVFATYPRNQSAAAFAPVVPGAVNRFGPNQLELFRPVMLKNEIIGTIYLRGDFREMRSRLHQLAWTSGAVMITVILVAYLLAARLQRVISVPISELAMIASRVAVEKDYSIRGTKRGDDDLGRLIDGFNEMLGQIQARDRALQAAHDRLEHRVEERTAKLAEASGLLEAMLENSPDLIYFKDRASRFVRFSKACYVGFGLAGPDRLLGKTEFDFYAPGQAQSGFADEQEIIRTGVPIIGQLECVSYADGRRPWLLTTKMPWCDVTGTVVGTFGISRDVTALKDAEDKLAHERDQLRELFESIPDSIYFKDAQSRFTRVSRSKVRDALAHVPDLRARRAARGLASDVADEEVLNGMTDVDTFAGEDAQIAYADEQRIIASGEALIGQLERRAYLDGRVTWSLTSKMPWRDRARKIIGTFGISKDITQLKEAEQALEEMHRQLHETSRQAGMAEVATGVLHNVGNVLNSVNVSATLVAGMARGTKSVNIAKLAAMLNAQKDNLGEFLTTHPRGKLIPNYLTNLAESLAAEHTSLLAELDHLCKNIDHIKEIVAMQQAYATTSGMTETIAIVDLIEDALRINTGSLERQEVAMTRDFRARPVVITDKHKVMQILINLIRNAKLACLESSQSVKRVTVRTTANEHSVMIAVIDNGVGIPAENLVRIFNHGFTTRKDGHGFGLHGGALAARELGGSLHVESDGAGQGATFELTLPLVRPEVA